MKAYWRKGGKAPHIPSICTRWRWMVSFMPQPLTPGVRAPSSQWVGGWVNPRAGLSMVGKRKESHHCPYQELNCGCPLHSLVSILTELPWLWVTEKLLF
jgi:hypothetical protein